MLILIILIKLTLISYVICLKYVYIVASVHQFPVAIAQLTFSLNVYDRMELRR